MSAGDAIQAAIAGSLDSVAELSGVFDGPPARAAFPYVTIDAAMETDWSHKNGQGREVMIGLTVWDDQPVRLRTLAKGLPLSLRMACGNPWHSKSRSKRSHTASVPALCRRWHSSR